MVTLLLLLSLLADPQLTVAARVDAEREVERARHEFAIGATKPFDQLYPRSFFEARVAREMAEEAVLWNAFGLSPSDNQLAQEFDRIERTTLAPEQWAAIKQALGNDRRLIEEVFCRPLLVARALRSRFAFDPKIHAEPHLAARKARSLLMSENDAPGASVLLLRRRNTIAPTTDALLKEAKREAFLPRVIRPPTDIPANAPIAVDPELATVLEKQLRRTGDVTTILEERVQFEVFRLIEATDETWKVLAVRVAKVDFEVWFAEARRALTPR